MFKKIYFGLIALLAFAQVQAQSPITSPDSSYRKCGVTKELRDAMIVPAEPGSRFASALVPGYPSVATEVCGHFTLHYEDIRLGLLQGYNEPAGGLGVMRRNNLCQVIQYIESVLDFSLVPSGGINILVDRSDTYIGKGKGSVGLPFLSIPAGVHPTVDGFVNSFIRTGTDPAPGRFHGMIGIDFEPMLIGYYIVTPTNSDLSVTEACGIDLAAMELHQLSHVLGMFSFVDEDGSGTYKTISSPPITNDPFTSLDLAVHTTPDPETSTDPFLGSSLFPFVSSGFSFTPSSSATDRKFWLNGSQPPYNHGMEIANTTPAVWHFIGMGSSSKHPRLSPGDYQDYVTLRYEAFSSSPMRRQWTKGEREMFTTTMGYTYNPTYASAHATAIANHVPYSTKMGSNTYNHIYNSFDGPEKIPADFTITNDIGTSLVIDLTADGTLQDADGDPISIFPGSLVNFRGCGQGGNNHNLLSVNGAGNEITYTPREDFYGRAQLGFNLYDGRERGAFVIYTIDVRKGTNVAIPAGENIVLNGSFEEGSEVKVIGTLASETINNSAMLSPDHAGRLGYHFADSHPYESLKSAIGSVVINNTADNGMCLATNKTIFGGAQMTFPAPWWLPLVGTEMPNPPLVTEKRYRGMGNPGLLMYLGENMQQCKRYALEFYASRTCLGFAYPAKEEIKFGFTDDAHMQGSSFAGGSSWAGKIENVDLVYSPTASTPAEHAFTKGEWQKVKISFTYCDTTAANILYLDVHDWWGPTVDPGLSPAPLILDSVSLKEVGFDVDIAITPAGGCDRTLVANPTEIASYGCSGTLFTWTDMSGTVLGTGKELTVSAMSLKSYIVIADDGCGHTAADTAEVTPCPCAPSEVFRTSTYTELSGTAVTGTFTSGCYYIPANITITGTTNFTGAKVMIAQGVLVTVAPTAKLILDSCHLFTCPDSFQMWQGIVLASSGSNSGRIEVKNNSMIEDAYYAINANLIKAPVSGDIIKSTNSIYNRNWVSINISNGYALGAAGTYPITLSGNIFTARYFDKYNVSGYPLKWPGEQALRAATTVIDATPSYFISKNYPRAICKDGQMSYLGVLIDNVGTTFVPGSSYGEVLVGGGPTLNEANLFDNHRYGLHSYNSNTTIRNNIFINIGKRITPSSDPASIALPDYGGIGAVAQSTPASPNNRFQALTAAGVNAGNWFYDCFFGIYTDGIADLELRDCLVTSSHRIGSPAPGAAYPTETEAGIGIISSNKNYLRYNVSGNYISNMNIGIYAEFGNPRAGATAAISANRLKGADTIIAIGLTGKQYMKHAISTAALTYSGPTVPLNITLNRIAKVFNGIQAYNFQNIRVSMLTNNISLWDTVTALSTVQNGIRHWWNYGTNTADNNVATPSLSAPNIADRITGMYTAFGANNKVCGNTTTNIGRGFEFAMTTPQPGTRWLGNTMTSGYKGFILGSDIGDQGFMYNWYTVSPLTFYGAIRDKWNISGGGKLHTEVTGFTKSMLSKLYVKSGMSPIELPITNVAGVSGNEYKFTGTTGSILLATATQWDANCDGAIYPPLVDNNPVPVGGFSLGKLIMGDGLGYDAGFHASQWMAQLSLYQMGINEPSLRDSVGLFDTFMTVTANSRYAWILNVQAALDAADITTAQNLLANYPVAAGRIQVNNQLVITDYNEANHIVNNYRDYFSAYARFLDSSMTNTDSSLIDGLSLKCPALDGAVVYQARVFHNLLTHDFRDYNDDGCALTGYSSLYRIIKEQEPVNDMIRQSYTLFPNPNEGRFSIRQQFADDELVDVKLYNATGMLLGKEKQQFSNGTLNFRMANPVPGLYLVCLTDKNQKTTCLKFNIE